MFHLTPQEKSALAWILTVCLVGSILYYALNRGARPLRWATVAGQRLPATHRLPDINTATVEQIVKLPGIGPKMAQKIVDYRRQNGPFMSVYGLRKVPGMTKKNLDAVVKQYTQGGGDE